MGCNMEYKRRFMKVCEDCRIKDTCKFKEQVEEYEAKLELPKPLEHGLTCWYKDAEPIIKIWFIVCPMCRASGRVTKRRWGLTKTCPVCKGERFLTITIPFPLHGRR